MISYKKYVTHRDLHSFPTRRSSDLCEKTCHSESLPRVTSEDRGCDLGSLGAMGLRYQREVARLHIGHKKMQRFSVRPPPSMLWTAAVKRDCALHGGSIWNIVRLEKQ